MIGTLELALKVKVVFNVLKTSGESNGIEVGFTIHLKPIACSVDEGRAVESGLNAGFHVLPTIQ